MDDVVTTHPPAVGGTWDRAIVGWHTAFWLMLALTALRVAISAMGVAARVTGLVVVAVMALAYLIGVQGGFAGKERRSQARQHGMGMGAVGSYVYLVLAIVGTGVMCSIDGGLAMLLFIVYPHTWMLTESRRHGIAFTAALSTSATLGFLAKYGVSWPVLRDVGPQMLVSMLFSILLGMWIWRVVDQSRERAELIAALEATRSELAAAHHAQGVAAERERLAREIHDTLAQGFTSIVMLAQAAAAGQAVHPERTTAHLATIEDVARENLAEARALVSSFSPPGLDGSTLADAVRRLVDRFGRETGPAAELSLGDGVAGLTRAQEVVLLRAVQEALANVRRHAGAGRVVVTLTGVGVTLTGASAATLTGASAATLTGVGGGVLVEVRDDGAGFEVGAVTGGFGLSGLRARVAEAGGEFTVDSRPGQGTRVSVQLPVAAPEGSPAQEVRS